MKSQVRVPLQTTGNPQPSSIVKVSLGQVLAAVADGPALAQVTEGMQMTFATELPEGIPVYGVVDILLDPIPTGVVTPAVPPLPTVATPGFELDQVTLPVTSLVPARLPQFTAPLGL